MLLVQGRAVGAKLLVEYCEVKGYADAVRWALRAGSWSLVTGRSSRSGAWAGTHDGRQHAGVDDRTC